MLISLIALLASCDDTEFASHSVVVEGEGYEAVREVFDGNCTTSCHSGESPSAGLNLSEDPCTALVGVEGSTGDDLVAIGSAEDSLLWQRIAGETSTIMPPTGAMDQANVDIIGDWIDDGAVCEDGSGDGGYDWPEGSELEPVYNQAFSTCKACHGESNPLGGISLTEENLIPELSIYWIVPGDVGNSPLLQKMHPDWDGEGDPMPKPDGSSTENIAAVADWIDAGANP